MATKEPSAYSPFQALYTDGLHSIFRFLSLTQLNSTLVGCRAFRDAAYKEPSRRVAITTDTILPPSPPNVYDLLPRSNVTIIDMNRLTLIMKSPLRHHIGTVRSDVTDIPRDMWLALRELPQLTCIAIRCVVYDDTLSAEDHTINWAVPRPEMNLAANITTRLRALFPMLAADGLRDLVHLRALAHLHPICFDDNAFSFLPQFKNLRSLTIRLSFVNVITFTELASLVSQCTQLTTLRLVNFSSFDGTSMRQLVGALPRLITLTLCDVDQLPSLDSLVGASALKQLCLFDCRNLRADDLLPLAHIATLRALGVDIDGEYDDVLSSIAHVFRAHERFRTRLCLCNRERPQPTVDTMD